ncbi:MAG TPA: type II toxin-antitoxin system VapC family toxin [Ktedonobacterales bacterium]|nr:type II toxin-antitoxin system VapC family toxin [Ktedonobacterales bacterium]
MSVEYLLDTGVLNAYLRGRKGAVERIDGWMAESRVSTSILVYAEIVEFVLGLPDAERRHAELRQVLAIVHPYQLTYPILVRYALLRREMRQPHGPGIIGDVDTLIAATAMERNATVATIDGDFTRVPGLRIVHLDRASLR